MKRFYVWILIKLFPWCFSYRNLYCQKLYFIDITLVSDDSSICLVAMLTKFRLREWLQNSYQWRIKNALGFAKQEIVVLILFAKLSSNFLSDIEQTKLYSVISTKLIEGLNYPTNIYFNSWVGATWQMNLKNYFVSWHTVIRLFSKAD